MTAVSVLLLALGLTVAGIGSMSVLRNYLTQDTDYKITSLLANIDQFVHISDSANAPVCTATPVPDYYLAVLDESGGLLCDNKEGSGSASRPDSTELNSLDFSSGESAHTVANASGSGHWRVVALPYMTPSNHAGWVVVGQDLKATDATISRYAAIFLFFAFTVVLLGGALTRLLVTSAFTPLREVEATAARFAAGDFTQRLGGATPNTEVGRLNSSLNSMLSRIDYAFADRAKTIDQMRRFVGDASHELRTPLVSVRGYAELYRMGALTTPEDVGQAMERIEKEAIRMGELVTDLLELARIDEAKPLQLAEVDLVPIASDVALDSMASSPDRVVSVVFEEIPYSAADDNAPETTDATGQNDQPRPAALGTGPIAFAGATLARLRGGRRPRTSAPVEAETGAVRTAPVATSAVVLAEENKIRQVLTNLIGNALRFTPAGTPIEIGVTADRAHGLAVLSVIDHGEGIPPQIREKIFQRFWRADSSRNRDTGGSGLGLAIVASIVAAHEGEVKVVETPGGGATFRVILPLLPPQQESQEVPAAEA
ncbi:MAG: histidine kinase [Microbacteriaceae bacterium]|nr:histidine kinase [Microbacteriaceae bacterium]